MQLCPDQIGALPEVRRVLKPGGRVGIAVWAKGYARDIEQVLRECLRRVGAKQPTYPSFGAPPEDLTCEDRALEISVSGGMEKLLEGWAASTNACRAHGAGPESGTAVGRPRLGPSQHVMHDGVLRTQWIAGLTLATAPMRGLMFWLTRNTSRGLH
jgi:hypothetical protein